MSSRSARTSFAAICWAVVSLAVVACGKGTSGDVGPAGQNGATGATGSPGSTGATGATGTPGSTGAIPTGTVNGVVTIAGTTPVAGAAGVSITATPIAGASSAVVNALAQADGSYSLALPIGSWSIVFGSDASDGFDPAPAVTANVIAGASLAVNGSVAPTNTVKVSFKDGAGAAIAAPQAPIGGSTPTIFMAGFNQPIAVSAALSGVPAGAGAPTYTWSIVPPALPTGVKQAPVAISATGANASFTTPTFDSVVFDPDDATYGVGALYTDATWFADMPNVRVPLRHGAVGVPVWVESRLTYSLKVTVSMTGPKGGKLSSSGVVAVRPAMYSAASQAYKVPGGSQTDTVPRYIVPVGQPALFGAPRMPINSDGTREAGSYNWTVSGPSGSSITAVDLPNGQFASFVPDVEGVYTLTSTMKDHTGAAFATPPAVTVKGAGTNATDAKTIPGFSVYAPWTVKIIASSYAGWTGAGAQSNDAATCATCHQSINGGPSVANASIQPFADYSQSAHSQLFASGLDGFQGSHYSVSCSRCHTTGFSEGHSVQNSGFDDVALATHWSFPSGANALVDGVSKTGLNSSICSSSGNNNPAVGNCLPPQLASLAAISCESCHGPGWQHHLTAGDNDPAVTKGAYIGGTFSDQSCQQCHNGSSHHDRGAMINKSPHSSKDLAIADATIEARQSTALHCGRCHGAGGYAEYVKQVAGVGTGVTTSNAGCSDQYGNTLTGAACSAGAAGNISNLVVTTASSLGNPTAQETIDFIGHRQLTGNLIEGQGCVTCHEPHSLKLRVETVKDANGENPWMGPTKNMPQGVMLPAGFAFPGAGKGIVCMSCHNTRNGEHDESIALTSFSAPHTPSQTDILAGKNSYYTGAAGRGNLSKHAAIADTCVQCHMTINNNTMTTVLADGTTVAPLLPAGYTYGSGDNHTFTANVNICSSCHGGAGQVDGAGLQADIAAGLQDLGNAVVGKLVKQVNAYFAANPTGTINFVNWDPDSDTLPIGGYSKTPVRIGLSSGASWDTTFANLTNWNFNTEVHGSMSACATPTNPVIVTMSDGSTKSIVAPKQLCAQLGSVTIGNSFTVTVVNGGAVGVATFNLSGGGLNVTGATTAATYQVPISGSTFAGQVYGVQIKFPAGTYVANDTYTVNLDVGTAGTAAAGWAATGSVTKGGSNVGTLTPTLGKLYLVDPTTSPIPKAGWNYYLVKGDGSLGIHNPSYVYKVLSGPLPYLQ